MKNHLALLFVVGFCSGIFFFQCGYFDENEVIERPRFYTRDNEGVWVGKADSHLPVVTFAGKDTINVVVPLSPSRQPIHYIEVIMLMDGDRQVANKTFPFTFEEARATFKLPKPDKGTYRVVAKCNIHDVWMTPVVIQKDEKLLEKKK